jgi:acyl-CoA thioesterase-1
MTSLGRKLVFVRSLVVSIAVLTACGQEPARERSAVPRVETAAPIQAATPQPQPSLPRVVVLGDSLTAGFGIDPAQAFPALLQQRLDATGLKYQVVNAGLSGDTSAGGLSRLEWALEGDVRVLIVALGGNDALRGLPAAELRSNLSTIIERAQARDVKVVLAGMEAPPNFGHAYAVEFHEIYPQLAKKYRVALVPFLLKDVAGIEALNQRDGIHPNPKGAGLVADNVWTVLKPLVEGPTASQ